MSCRSKTMRSILGITSPKNNNEISLFSLNQPASPGRNGLQHQESKEEKSESNAYDQKLIQSLARRLESTGHGLKLTHSKQHSQEPPQSPTKSKSAQKANAKLLYNNHFSGLQVSFPLCYFLLLLTISSYYFACLTSKVNWYIWYDNFGRDDRLCNEDLRKRSVCRSETSFQRRSPTCTWW